MHAPARQALSRALVLGLFVAFAYSPLLRSGFLSWDYASVLAGDREGPLSSAWAHFSRAAWGLPTRGASAWGWRLESVLGLCALALGTRAFLLRFLTPWLGSESARGAGLGAAFVVALHPLSALAASELSGRAEIAGAVLSLGAGVLFLTGRQEQREGLVLAAFPVLIVAGFASSLVLAMALVLGLAELCAVRRHRRRSLRLRTAATTAVLFGVAAFLPRLLVEGVFPLPATEASLRGGARSLAGAWGATLGELALPERGLGAIWALLAGALLVLALRPAFRAARHAPRLWGGFFLIWGLILCAALAGTRSEGRATPLLAVVAWSAGLGLALAPLRESRRRVMVLVLGLGFATLTHASGRSWLAAAEAQARLSEALAGLSTPRDARVFLLDPPEVPGVPALGAELAWTLHPSLGVPGESARGEDGSFDPERVQALSSRAFLALASTEFFAGIRARGPLLVARTQPPGGLTSRLTSVLLSAPATRESAPLSFRALAFTPPTPLDPLDWEHAVFVAELASDPTEIERLGWQTQEGVSGSLSGQVAERDGRRVADFDLANSLDWRLAGRVRSLSVKGGIRGIERGELLGRLPVLEGVGAPTVAGEDWIFAPPPRELQPGGRFELGLLALADFSLLVVPLEPEPAGGLRAPGAARFARLQARADAPVCWLLDYRVGAQVLRRARGRVP